VAGSADPDGYRLHRLGNWSLIENPAWDIAAWSSDPTVQPVLSMPMWPNTGGSLAEAASGADNAHWAALAKNLIAGGLGTAILRIGWEFNGSWYPWSVLNATDAAAFAQAWRQIVGTIQRVPGQHFGFDWSMTASAGGVNPALAYPGDSYVTTVDMDVYDWNQTAGSTPAQRWHDTVTNGYGLAWQASFAAAHRKPISFAEWALAYNPAYPAAGGGDDPLCIQNMYNLFASHYTAFENYFDVDSMGLDFGITTGNGVFPNATALYRKLYSGS
jgi:hypothetical protein